MRACEPLQEYQLLNRSYVLPKLCVYCRNAESADDEIHGAGDPVIGANPLVKP